MVTVRHGECLPRSLFAPILTVNPQAIGRAKQKEKIVSRIVPEVNLQITPSRAPFAHNRNFSLFSSGQAGVTETSTNWGQKVSRNSVQSFNGPGAQREWHGDQRPNRRDIRNRSTGDHSAGGAPGTWGRYAPTRSGSPWLQARSVLAGLKQGLIGQQIAKLVHQGQRCPRYGRKSHLGPFSTGRARLVK